MDSGFEAAYASLRQYAMRVAHSHCFDWVRADEYADEGMFRLWRSWARVAERPESERRAFLAAIVRNMIIDDLRKSRPVVPLSDTFDVAAESEPTDDASDILLPLLSRAWPRLTVRQRAYVEASLAYDGPAWGSGAHLARAMGIKYESQKKLAQSTMRVLRAYAGYCGTSTPSADNAARHTASGNVSA